MRSGPDIAPPSGAGSSRVAAFATPAADDTLRHRAATVRAAAAAARATAAELRDTAACSLAECRVSADHLRTVVRSLPPIPTAPQPVRVLLADDKAPRRLVVL